MNIPAIIKARLARWLAKAEWPVKWAIFGCRACGQCVLRQTGLVCPMNCPKGLRNGPCGGTLAGRCEVDPQRECVWVQIGLRRDARGTTAPPTHAPLNEALIGSSSIWNCCSGADRPTRRPLPPLAATADAGACCTASRLEERLRRGRFVVTAELCTPSTEQGLDRMRDRIRALAQMADAINVTSNHAGVPRVAALSLARCVGEYQGEAILHLCGRDLDPRSYLDALVGLSANEVHNVLCLTGDWPARAEPSAGNRTPPRTAHYFPLEAAQMIYEASHLRHFGASALADLNARPAPRLCVGGAINPSSVPTSVVLARLAQKIACGVDFLQTQAVCDARLFGQWFQAVQQAGLATRVPILASVPLIGTARGLEVLRRLPGVLLSDDVYNRLRTSTDVAVACRRWSTEILANLASIRHLAGFHLLNFGAANEFIAESIQFGRNLAAQSSPVAVDR